MGLKIVLLFLISFSASCSSFPLKEAQWVRDQQDRCRGLQGTSTYHAELKVLLCKGKDGELFRVIYDGAEK